MVHGSLFQNIPMWIADLCIRRPVLAIMMTAAFMMLGVVSMGRISIDLFPSVEVPIVTVETILEGASPSTVETEVYFRSIDCRSDIIKPKLLLSNSFY